MTDKYFTLEGTGDIDANTLIMNKDAIENADELIEQGKAIKVDLSGYDSLRNESKRRHEKYQASRRKLLDSDDPIFSDKAKLDYELNKLRSEYDADVEAIRGRYEEYKQEAMTKAQEMKAQATVRVSERDRETAKQFVDRANIELLTHHNSKQSEVIEGITQDIANLTAEQRQALASELPSLLRSIDDTTARRKLASAVQKGDRNTVAVKLAEQLPNDVAIEYRQMQAITRSQGKRKY